TRFSRDWSSDVCSSDLPQQSQHLCRLGLEGPAQPLRVVLLHRCGGAGVADPRAPAAHAAAGVVPVGARLVPRQAQHLALRLRLAADDAAPHGDVAPAFVHVLRRHHAQEAAPSSTASTASSAFSPSDPSGFSSSVLAALLKSASKALCERSAWPWSARREAAACMAASRSETDSDGCRSML